MKKNTKRFSALLIAVLVICIVATVFVGCNPDETGNGEKKYNSETRPFAMSISQPDGVFNPFFSTSAYDSSIIGMTQISMLSTDAKGNIVCGENEPTVVKDYRVVENKGNNNKVESTTYEFLIKNGIKWSNGSKLTIKDVLFNLYVYLDPAYTGSATIYSTDIVGLKKYRTQQENTSDGSTNSFEESFVSKATVRISDAIKYVKYSGLYSKNDKPSAGSVVNINQATVAKDFAVIARAFKNELTSDWNAINKKDYEKWNFTETWQIFLLNDGGYTSLLQRKQGSSDFYKDDDGNYKLDEDFAQETWETIAYVALEPLGLATIDEETFEITITGSDKAVQDAIKNYCIESVFGNYFPGFLDKDLETGTQYADSVAANIINRKQDNFKLTSAEQTKILNSIIKQNDGESFETVALYWQTAATILETFTAEEKSAYFANLGADDKIAPNIEGIKTKTVKSFKGKDLNGTYDVLSVTINGVDPKAIYNFAFTVAPMYYYSTSSWVNDKGVTHNYIKEFNGTTNFGLEYGSSRFMNEVINASSKIGVPVGGGAYMASSASSKEKGVKAEDFFNNNMIYYVRNPYFETVGEGLSNAKIKTVRYKVVDSDQIIGALANGDIDLGDPNATRENIDDAEAKGLNHIEIDTAGYGYVGINPRFVPSVVVRRIIMRAMNTQQIIDNYYKGGLASLIRRPMSKTNWAYPTTATTYTSRNGFSYAYTNSTSDVERLLKADGYDLVDGVWQRNIPGFGLDRLDYKFTIAGGSTDHPAYNMFLNAAKILNSCGFAVKVVTSQTALTDLSSGKLEVWAAAWSSAIDPDMYQVYHKDSQASSVKNWGYSQILGDTAPVAWGDELLLVGELSDLIDEGRQTTKTNERKRIYKDALDVIMEMAVECPTYQRKDMTAYKANLLDPATLPTQKQCSPYSGLLARIWEVDYL